MELISKYPKNKSVFSELLRFAEEMMRLCSENDINPIVWGSLAYFAYTEDTRVDINDIDFLIPERDLQTLRKKVNESGLVHKFIEGWDILQVFDGQLKIEFDTLERYSRYPGRFEVFDIDGLVVNVVILEDLKLMYEKASKESKDKPEQHRKRLDVLNKL